jgi:ATP-dependent 26S proteasome regulatory subunit
LREQAAAQKVVEAERKEKDAKAAVLAREAEAARAEEERRRKDAEAKVELEKRKKEAQQKFQQEQRTSTPAPSKVAEEKPMTIAEAGNIVSRFEEIIQEEKRVIKQITIKRERHTFVYRKVKYDWGGVYFFKNDMDITKLDFDNESAAVK